MLRQLVDCHELLASASVDGAGVERLLGSHGLNDTSHLRVTEGAAFTDFVKIVVRGITPHGNGLDHVNSLLQTATVTDAPVVGVAITAETVVPGSATGASRAVDPESAARFCIDVAKLFTTGHSHRYDPAETGRLTSLYGSMKALQTRAPSHPRTELATGGTKGQAPCRASSQRSASIAAIQPEPAAVIA